LTGGKKPTAVACGGGGRILLWLFAGAALLLSACGADQPQLAHLDRDAVILAFGDSLTHGTGVDPEQSYPTVLAGLIGRKVVNAGIPGEITRNGLQRLPGVLDEVRPKLVILCHGGNDLLRRLDPKLAERNLREMVRLIREYGAEVVLVGVPAPSLLLGTAKFYQRIADDLAIPIESDILPELLGDNRYKSDAVHPNAAGYRRLANALAVLLKARGAI